MIDFEFISAGGQGSLVAAKLLADTIVKAGWNSQAFSTYGAERHGDKVESSTPIINANKIAAEKGVALPSGLPVIDTTVSGTIIELIPQTGYTKPQRRW